MSIHTLQQETIAQLKRRREGSNAYMAWWLVQEDLKAYHTSKRVKDTLEYWIVHSKIRVRKEQWKYALFVLKQD